MGVAPTPFSRRPWPGWRSLALVTWQLYSLAGRAGRQWGGTHQGPFPFHSDTVLGFIRFGVVFVGVSLAAALAFLLSMAFAKRGGDAPLLLLLLGLLGLPCRRSGLPTSLVEGRGKPRHGVGMVVDDSNPQRLLLLMGYLANSERASTFQNLKGQLCMLIQTVIRIN